jgi:NCAIR mutase (PurE)-related protein
MLTSCANLAVFNNDNGVGAALFAFRVQKAQVAK